MPPKGNFWLCNRGVYSLGASLLVTPPFLFGWLCNRSDVLGRVLPRFGRRLSLPQYLASVNGVVPVYNVVASAIRDAEGKGILGANKLYIWIKECPS